MDMLTALLQFLLALLGVDTGTATFNHRTTDGGVDTLYSIATVESGIARFECLASASGQCVYTVFPETCAGTPTLPGMRLSGCDLAPPRRFALPEGGTQEIAGLHPAAVCVRGDRADLVEDCRAGG